MRSLPRPLIEPLVAAALREDLGRAGDLTTDAIIPSDATATVQLVSREPGVVAGLPLAQLAWGLLDPSVQVAVHLPDGSRVRPGDAIATVTGPARALLTGERVALNFLGHLSGVATGTASIADAIAHTRARVADTRKTIPGLRAVQKYAVACGGGSNHRFGLDDAVLIKDNHIAVAGGLRAAVRAARAHVGHLVKIEVEVDTLAMLAELLDVGADVVLLDNMTPDELRQAVAMVDGAMITEASGRITPETAGPIAEAGVDLISVGWLTHSARVLDIGLDHASNGHGRR
ncbi:MAG TPA: carboxylating nicotinate-nucleotide diphosphorylase [Arachnia sp.]|nr:carboxylating nicotinate-nucleotide diphosphorylase [Arachnia sp.]HMT87768.1 carboxylating nicotinate-nucleotide diphosphorylase [Arachnia sp.]